MTQVKSELFAQFIYSPDLTYDELHEKENTLLELAEQLLQDHLGAFINFEPVGDTLHAQCLFETHGESLCHSLCDQLAGLMDGDVEARLLFVRKDLEMLSLYTIAHNGWQEAVLAVPPAGPLGKRLRVEAAGKE